MHIAAPTANEPRINDRIRAREVRLVGADGSQLGIKALPEALQIAREADMDLVEVAAQAAPPVCRIMDYSRFKYEEAQKARESRRKSTNVAIKEMKYRVKIGQGDFDTKTRKVAEFLQAGHKVKITIMFRGREQSYPHLGKAILDRVAEQCAEFAKVEAAPKLDGRNMIMVIAPDKKAATAPAKAAATRTTAPEGAAATAASGANGASPPPPAAPSSSAPAAPAAPEAHAAPEAGAAPNGAAAPAAPEPAAAPVAEAAEAPTSQEQ